MYQPLLRFLQNTKTPETCNQQAIKYEIETKNRFSVLIDEASIDIGTFDNVINLSDRQLNDTELKILNMGLHFCPTPITPDLREIRRDLDKFHRSLRIQWWLNKNGNDIQSITPGGPFKDIRSLKKKSESTWAPPPGPPNLEHIISNEIGLLYKQVLPTHKSNITSLERKCISGLTNYTSIVVKKSDKGGAIVLQNRKDYIAEEVRQLSDGKFYTKLDHDPTTEHNIKMKPNLMLCSKEVKSQRKHETSSIWIPPETQNFTFYQRYIKNNIPHLPWQTDYLGQHQPDRTHICVR